jgi:hypothetical protein
MSQSSVRERNFSFKGGFLADNARAECESVINGTRQESTVTVTAANLLTTLTLDGTAITVNAGGATLSTSAIAEILAYAIEASGENVFIKSIAANVIRLGSLDGSAFTVAGTANCSVATPVAATAGGVTVPFGCAVVIDANNAGKGKLPTATGEITNAELIGIAVGMEHSDSVDSGYAFDDVMSVCYSGVMWAKKDLGVALSRDDDVFVRHVAGAGEQLGALRNDADTTDATQISYAIRFIEDAAATDEYVKVRISLP